MPGFYVGAGDPNLYSKPFPHTATSLAPCSYFVKVFKKALGHTWSDFLQMATGNTVPCCFVGENTFGDKSNARVGGTVPMILMVTLALEP